MDSASTSLISKWMRLLLAGGLIFQLFSCSSSKKISRNEEDQIKITEELNALTKNVQAVHYGPTVSSGAAFIDKTNDYGLSGIQAVTMNAVDINFDGRTDLVVLPSYYSRPKFYVFKPGVNRFEQWSHDPLPADFKASYVLFYDVNKDKIIDLISGVLNQRSEVGQVPLKLYLGQMERGHIKFVHDPEALKLIPEPSSSVSLIDYDLDGQLDLFVGNWFEHKKGEYRPVSDRLMKNNKGKFEDVTVLLKGENVKLPDQLFSPNARPTYGSSTCDIDQNGFPDILTVSSSGHKNKLWMNLMEPQSGERFFDDIGPNSNYSSDPNGNLIPTGGGRSFFSACADYNTDGIMDVFLGELSHAYDNDSVDKSSILTGSKETYPPYFIRTEYLSDATSEAWNQGDRRANWMDFNNDGFIDLLVDNSGFPPYSRLVLFEQDETHAFMNVASSKGIDIVNPAASITLDINQDGWMDIITSQSNIRKADISPRIYVFENSLKVAGRRSYRVHLHGVSSNTHGLGAMVMLYMKKGNKKIVQRRWVEYSQGGLPSQNEAGVHFGTDVGTEVVGFKVRWPFLSKSGYKMGQAVEKLYSLQDYQNRDFVEVTLCEDGKILPGKMSCQY